MIYELRCIVCFEMFLMHVLLILLYFEPVIIVRECILNCYGEIMYA